MPNSLPTGSPPPSLLPHFPTLLTLSLSSTPSALLSSPPPPPPPPMAAALHFLLLLALAPLASSVAPAHVTPAPVQPPTKAPATPSPPSTPVPSDLPGILSKNGCKSFAGLLTGDPEALSIFENVIQGGLTVFCPTDRAVAAFMPHYKNLTAEGKSSLLLYHGMPVYNSLATLKFNNGVMNTLATDGTNKNYNVTVQDDGDLVALKTGVGTSSISGTAFDDKQYLAIFTISEVLQPVELFHVDEPPAPAPAPPPKAKGKKNKTHVVAEPPADSPNADAADNQKVADDSSRLGWSAFAAAAVAGVVILVA